MQKTQLYYLFSTYFFDFSPFSLLSVCLPNEPCLQLLLLIQGSLYFISINREAFLMCLISSPLLYYFLITSSLIFLPIFYLILFFHLLLLPPTLFFSSMALMTCLPLCDHNRLSIWITVMGPTSSSHGQQAVASCLLATFQEGQLRMLSQTTINLSAVAFVECPWMSRF